MKQFLTTTAVASLMASSALAGAVVYEAPEAVPMAAEITDWGGAYAGVTGSFVTSGTGTYLYPDPGDIYDFSGSAYGVFGGYNLQRGNLVYGGEIAAQFGTVELDNAVNSNFSNLIDAKARVGYALGGALVYGFAGFSTGAWDNLNSAGTTNPNGFNYGAGVDFMVTEKLFLGAEYIARDMTGWFENGNGINPVFSAVQVRAGMRF